jgi:hypothetical protein
LRINFFFSPSFLSFTPPTFLSVCITNITVFTTFWPLGLVAFGGPQAHVAILRDHLVDQRDWLDEDQFMELFAIGQVRLWCMRFSNEGD